MNNYTFQLFADCSHLWFGLFLPRFQFSLLTFIEFSIYSRLFYFIPSWNIFNPGWNVSHNCNFFQLSIPSWNFDLRWKSSYSRPLNQSFDCKLKLGYNNRQIIWDKRWFSCEVEYYGKTSISIFEDVFASIDEFFILGGRLSTRL